MCGIGGFIQGNKGVFAEHELREMALALRHRGPDARGFFFDGSVGLVHTRLSIIDLNEAANQPMTSECGRYTIVFNGEIYNYDELAREHRLRCRTSSDTEVILQLFIRFGDEAVSMFNGMYAIAIYDSLEKSLWIARDRMGVKPLFYYWNGETFAFGSELKALLCLSLINQNKTINYQAINEFLHLGYVPFPHTIWNTVHKFPTGSIARVTGTRFDVSPYWTLDQHVGSEVISDEKSAREQLRDLIVQSVRYRLKSDVPFGAFLSGGIDSSIVAAVAQHQLSTPLNTFSIAFEESAYNEAVHAKKVARFLRTNHHELTVTHREAKDLVFDMLDLFDEPFSDSSAIPTMIVSKLARNYVTMSLSGDGGDELFMGYGMYTWAHRLHNSAVHVFRKPLAAVLSLSGNRMRRAAKVIAYPNKKTVKSHVFSQEQYLFSRPEIGRVLNPSLVRDVCLDENVTLSRPLSPREGQSLFDMKYYLPDDLLVKVDRASMFYSLEARVPLLDYNIVEFSLNLHEDLKVCNGVQKYLLKEVLYDFVPRELFNRPKWGFSIPLQHWLRGDLRFLLDDFLSPAALQRTGLLDVAVVESIKKQYLEHNRGYMYNRLWQLVVLQYFMNKHM